MASGQPSHLPDRRFAIDLAPKLIHTSLAGGFLNFFSQTWLNLVGLYLQDFNGWKYGPWSDDWASPPFTTGFSTRIEAVGMMSKSW